MPKPYERIRSFNKKVLNPVLSKFAGSPLGPFALIRHVGRLSGKRYETPIIVRQTGRGFVIALTYGPSVDWYRNLQAAGRATLLWRGRQFAIKSPETLEAKAGLQAFPLPARAILRLRGTDDFVLVRSSIGAKAA